MSTKQFTACLCLLLSICTLHGAVPELSEFIPDASDYHLIYSCNPLEYWDKGYTADNSENLSGDLKRIGYFLSLTDRQNTVNWVFVSMDPFTPNLTETGVPFAGGAVHQTKVTNMEILSNAKAVATGKFSEGNIEFWSGNYSGSNSKNIPGAGGQYDFGDRTTGNTQGYGSMQVHNFLHKQTVFAYNNFSTGKNCDLGIGNAPKGHSDWTFSHAGKNCKSARLMIVAKIDNLKVLDNIVKINPAKTDFQVTSDKGFYALGEKMTFTCKINLKDQKLPTLPYFIQWIRTGDDGRKETRKDTFVPGKTFNYTTSIDKPGFVLVKVNFTDRQGRTLKASGRGRSFSLDCGAGAAVDTLKPAVEEPADFDDFWKKQKSKLAAVPLKYSMKKVSAVRNCDIYAVSIDCAGPRPVTGYLSMPRDAKEKSLPAKAAYQGYGNPIPRPISWNAGKNIYFLVNAHGYELGREDAYYKEFFAGIKSNGKIYAFDPKQNSDPETAYFNGMALRVMRSLEFLKSLPQWNGKDLHVSGGSQGGLQTIWAAALEPAVSYANSTITWCCDMNGTAAGRLNGWRPAYVPALRYYDAVFHARRIRCRIIIGRAGLGDYVCPPSGLAILYSNIGSADKTINWYQGSTHGFVPVNPQIFKITSKK